MTTGDGFETQSAIARFVASLFTDGRVRVPRAVDPRGTLWEPSFDELDDLFASLVSLERHYRNELPGIPLNLSRPAVLWGAMIVFRVSSFLAYRDIGADVIQAALSEPCPELPTPSACYSVDLTLRFLPDLIRLAKAISTDDPLVALLLKLGRDWPLSSVGIVDIGEVDPTPLVGDPCLKRIYVDRIIASKDRSRLNNTQVKESVRAAVGIHRELAPELVNSID
jgi:hypothetical protein